MSTKLKSSDGELFSVSNSLLEKSETLASMFNLCSPENLDDNDDAVELDKIHSKYLKTIVQWLQTGSLEHDKLEVNDLYHLIVHSDYLNIPDLVNQLCKILVNKIARREKLETEFQLIKKPQCFHDHCETAGAERLKVCAKCGTARYCSKDCQKDDWAQHKISCKRISSMTKGMNKEAAPLRVSLWDKPCNLFEEQVGHFWGIHETRPYCRYRFGLAEALSELAEEKRQSFLYEKSLSHYMELMRLIHGDNMGLRHFVPAIFLKLNRDEDCHNFIKWWCTIDPIGEYDWGGPSESKEGDWLYLTNQDIYEDAMLFSDGDIQFLNALLCIRLRIVSKFKLMEAVEKCIDDSTSGNKEFKPLHDILPSIRKIVLGEKSSSKYFSLDKQVAILNDILVSVKLSNKSFLPAILNPDPLLNCKTPTGYSQGSFAEAYFAVQPFVSLFSSISISKEVIKEFCGDDTSYEVKIIDKKNYLSGL